MREKPDLWRRIVASLLRAWLVRLRDLFNKRNREMELSEEIESNLEMHIQDNVGADMPIEEARRSALVKFGSIDAAKEACRDRRGIPFVDALARDISESQAPSRSAARLPECYSARPRRMA